jgi:probable rRNA maturation factor
MENINLNLQLRIDDPAWQAQWTPALSRLTVRAVETALLAQKKTALKYPAYEVSILLAGNAAAARLNTDHRGKDYVPNVLSFPMDRTPPAPGEPVMLGDLVLAHDVIAAEAKAQGKTFRRHYAHLLVHGTLHVCGYDHETSGQARTMMRLEKEILASLNIPDPY